MFLDLILIVSFNLFWKFLVLFIIIFISLRQFYSCDVLGYIELIDIFFYLLNNQTVWVFCSANFCICSLYSIMFLLCSFKHSVLMCDTQHTKHIRCLPLTDWLLLPVWHWNYVFVCVQIYKSLTIPVVITVFEWKSHDGYLVLPDVQFISFQFRTYLFVYKYLKGRQFKLK